MPEVTIRELVASGVLQVGDGYRTRRDQLGQPGVPILRVAEVQDGRLEPRLEDFVRDEYRPSIGSKLSRPNDVVVTTKGTVGRAVLISDSDPELVYSPQLCFFRVHRPEELDPQWLFTWFRSPLFLRQARAVQDQTDMAAYINLADVNALSVEVPDPATQGRVVEVVASLDQAMEAARRVAQACTELAVARLQQSISDSLARMPVYQVADVRRGLSYKGSGLAAAGMPMVNLANARAFGGLKREGFKYYTEAYKPRHVAHAGDLLVANTEQTWRNEILGWPMLVPDDMPEVLFSHHISLIDFHPGNEWMRLPLWAYLFTTEARARVEAFAHGTTVAALPGEALEGMEFPVPDQDDLVLEAAAALLARAWAAERESAALVALRDALLPELVSGRIRVRDVGVEAAS